MAHNELALDSNVIDVAFSKSGSRIAVLMRNRFSVFAWSLKNRPVPSPILESSYPLSDAPESRPRQIAFLNENEVYVLRDIGPNNTQIERTMLDTRSTNVVHQTVESELLYSIFPAVGHEELWFSHTLQPGMIISYSSAVPVSADSFEVADWAESPAVDTYWAKPVKISGDEVIPEEVSSFVGPADFYSAS